MTTATETVAGARLPWWRVMARRAWAGLRLRDAAMLSLAPLAAVTWLVGSSVEVYRRGQNFQDWFSAGLSVPQAFRDRAHAALRMPGAIALGQRFTPQARDAGVIRLMVSGRGWDSVTATDMSVWDNWTGGTLEYGGSSIPIRVRKRGDFSVHWLTDKRSLTVRTPRDQFYKTFRSFGLSAKTPLESFVANRFATSFGLLVPRTEVVPVFLNDRFYGIYRLVEPVDESFLRPLDRMPGNIFRGDRAARGEYFKGQNRNLFENPNIWDRAAVSDRPTGAGAGQLRLMLDELGDGSFEAERRMMGRFDRDELGRLMTYLFVTGDIRHMDGVHNQLLYEDPSTQQLHPIPWDIRLRPLDAPDAGFSDLMKGWLRDPFVVEAINRHLADALRDSALRHVVDSLATTVERRYADYFDYERRRAGLIPDVGTASAAIAVVDHNLAILRDWLRSDTVALGTGTAGGETVLDLETRGRIGVDLVALTAAHAGALRVWRDANLNGVHDASDPEVSLGAASGGRAPLRAPATLYASLDVVQQTIVPGHVPYRFFVRGLPPHVALTAELRNRETGAAAAVVAWEVGAPIRPVTGWHPWRYPAPAHRTHRLAGLVRITETIKIPAGDTLLILPGTTLRLAPDISIISLGRVIARGTAAQPIRIMDDVPGHPWGTFAMFGAGADSSIVEHAEFTQGGGALVDRVEYTGMVNVHRAHDVLFDHVFFHDNVRSDDTFHALHSSVTIRNSRFENANGDAIDFDISSGTLSFDTIINSVNDAMDLMTSTPWISDNVITGSGDKGISVGEASNPIIFNNLITGCVRGIEAKDRSAPLILNNELNDNGVSIRERRKNWRYGGGPFGIIMATTFRHNGAVQHDPLSRWTLWQTIGLDTLEEKATPMMHDLDWLYGRLGVRVSGPATPGRVAHYARVAPVPPMDRQRFTDDFGDVSDGWRPAGGTTRLEKREAAMVLETERLTGTAARPVTWDLPRGGQVIIEVAGRDIASGRLIAVGPAGEVAAPFGVSDAVSSFRFAVLHLPPGRYHELRIEATPSAGLSHAIRRKTGLAVLRAGRLWVRGYEVYGAASAPSR